MKIFIFILLLTTVVCASARYSTTDNSRTANQIVRVVTTEGTAYAGPAGTGCSCYTEPAVKSSYNVTLSPICLLPLACNAACMLAGTTGGFCDGNMDCMCYPTR